MILDIGMILHVRAIKQLSTDEAEGDQARNKVAKSRNGVASAKSMQKKAKG